MSHKHHVVVIGGGISGLTSAYALLSQSPVPIDVTVLDASTGIGGLIRTTPFAGLPAVDEGADSFLVRVPFATQLTTELGMSDSLTSPASSGAYVWHNRLHDIPGDLMMGVPAKVRSFATSGLISPLGKLRAALEPLLPRTDDNDNIGEYVRKRFGDQIHERLVDPLIGSIYAADTDYFSIAAVPQIAALTAQRSMLFAARKARTNAAKTPTGPIFATPLNGMGTLVDTLAARVVALGGQIKTSQKVTNIEKTGKRYDVVSDAGVESCDAVVIASPAKHSADFVRSLQPHAAGILAQWEHASVVLITMAIPGDLWPAHLTGSGYLVPKPDQRWVTAVSFGSNKWRHWNPTDGSKVLRISLGRDGLDVMHFDNDKLVNLALADLKHHLGIDLVPLEIRISRWVESFPQYRPYHFARLGELEHSLHANAPGIVFAGASYRGIGIPACIQQGRAASESIIDHLATLEQ